MKEVQKQFNALVDSGGFGLLYAFMVVFSFF